MAAGSIAPPGTEYGPCVEPCKHIDCAATRKQAATPCVTCGEPLGYDVNFFRNHDDFRVKPGDEPEYEHAMCTYKRLDAE